MLRKDAGDLLVKHGKRIARAVDELVAVKDDYSFVSNRYIVADAIAQQSEAIRSEAAKLRTDVQIYGGSLDDYVEILRTIEVSMGAPRLVEIVTGC